MADYSYFAGDGKSRLDSSTPIGNQEPSTTVDNAIRQSKAYLCDATAGPAALLDSLEAAIAAVVLPTGNVPVGAIIAHPVSSSLPGFLLMTGGAVSTATYPSLQALLTTKFGSAGAGQFRLPDTRGRVIAGYDSGLAGFNVISNTGIGGSYTHTVNDSETPSHVHGLPEGYNILDHLVDGPGFIHCNGALPGYLAGPLADRSGEATSPASPHDNVQPVAGVYFHIKAS